MKWHGYPSEQNTWEPKRNLNCPLIIAYVDTARALCKNQICKKQFFIRKFEEKLRKEREDDEAERQRMAASVRAKKIHEIEAIINERRFTVELSLSFSIHMSLPVLPSGRNSIPCSMED